jgi:predicted secreted hydrolase
MPDRGWKIARPDYDWAFPRDHWAHHDYQSEWWYFSGHLNATDEPIHRFSYQITIFRIGLAPQRPIPTLRCTVAGLLLGHVATADLSMGRRLFRDFFYPEYPLLSGFGDPPEQIIAWFVQPAPTNGSCLLRWNGEAFDLEMQDQVGAIALCLSTHPLKPLVLQGPNGYMSKGVGPYAGSQYYTFPRLASDGTLTLDGQTWKVRGSSWMDREFGSFQLSDGQVGWDWFGLHLDENRELMLYIIRKKDGAPDRRHGTLISAEGRPRYLEASEWSFQATDTWTSSATEAVYPTRWVVELGCERLRLEIIPEFPEQENVSRIKGIPSYWEGAVRIFGPNGRPVGKGYVELTGYGENNRPAI